MARDPFFFEKEAWGRWRFVAGLDEAGRGAWAGPVVAAAVVFEPGIHIAGVDDSKKLSPAKREKLFEEITSKASYYAIGMTDAPTIDAINILRATQEAMLKAVAGLAVPPDFLLIDGNTGLDTKIPQRAVVDGDALSFTIAAASILAKVTRDRLMVDWSRAYPDYGFEKHKGYGTKTHQEALRRVGCSELHRRSFAPIAEILSESPS